MRIRCPYCQTKAIVTHTVKLSDHATEAYINCPNKDCGARTVMRISFAYVLTPPESTLLDSLHEQIANMNPDDRRKLLKIYS